MPRPVFLLLGFIIVIVEVAVCSAGSMGSIPNKNTPRELQEAWLEFHKTGLCQEIDAVFVFHGYGVEVWSRIESDRQYQKFQALFEPLKAANSVTLYITRAETDKKKDADDPPPSLWQNIELRRNLGEFAPAIAGLSMEESLQFPSSAARSGFGSFMKQRLRIYADQVLDWSRRMERYSQDLVALTRVAHGPDGLPDMKPKAIAAAKDHAQNMGKMLGKLSANLEQAFPLSERTKRRSSQPEKPVIADRNPVETAMRISSAAQRIAQRVHRFIFPENYTVKLDELRNPSLLESIGTLRQMVAEFEKTLGKPARNK